MNTQNTQQHLGGEYLKVGRIKPNRDGSAKHVRCVVSGRNGGARVVPERKTDKGTFGPALEIPTEIEGQEFVVSIPADKGDGKTLRTVFGDDLGAWTGKAFDLYESEVLDRIRVVPVG